MVWRLDEDRPELDLAFVPEKQAPTSRCGPSCSTGRGAHGHQAHRGKRAQLTAFLIRVASCFSMVGVSLVRA